MKRLVFLFALLLCSLSGGMASAYEVEGVEIHGFLSQGYLKTTKENGFPVIDSGDGTFKFNDFGINFSKQITPALRVGLQLFAFDRGTYGRDEVTLDWAYGDYRYNDWLGFRAGKVKIPLGLYNEARDNDALRTFIFLPQQAYLDYERDSLVAIIGGGIYGSIPLEEAGALNYQLLVGNVPAVSDGGFATEIGSMMSTESASLNIDSISSKTSFAHSLEWRTPVPGLRSMVTGLHTTLSGNGTATAEDDGRVVAATWKYDSLHRYMFSLEYAYQDLVLSGEYELDDYTLRVNYDDPLLEPFDSKQESDAWSIMATYRFTDWFELGSYYHEVYADRHNRDGSTYANFGLSAPYNMWWKDLALCLRFDPVPNVVLKVEGHKVNGNYEVIENFEGSKKDWYIFATKATFSF